MEEESIMLKPNWNITAELWVTCSKCDFAILVPLVAMIGKKSEAPSSIKFTNPKGMWGMLTSLFGPRKDSGERIFGFMLPGSKYCNKCKTTYISKEDKSIKLKDKYWEKLDNTGSADFVHNLETNTIDFNVLKEEKCLCGEKLIIIQDCPKCKNLIKFSAKDINGIPVIMHHIK